MLAGSRLGRETVRRGAQGINNDASTFELLESLVEGPAGLTAEEAGAFAAFGSALLSLETGAAPDWGKKGRTEVLSPINEAKEKTLQEDTKTQGNEDLMRKHEAQMELHRGEQMFLRLFAGDITRDDYEFLQATPPEIYTSLPTTSVIPRPFGKLIAHLSGPDNWQREASFLHHACGRAISTYPYKSGFKRDGDPICDAFQYKLYSQRAILAVTDGCNWGDRSRNASRTANRVFVEHMEAHQASIHTVREAGHHLLRAASHAHTAIKEEAKQRREESGTTTLFGGILLEVASDSVASPKPQEKAEWVFVCINVGDCKAFCVRPSERDVVEISIGNRTMDTDATDPGGRLGVAGPSGRPDLRNLELFSFACKEDDILIVCSDGIFDNLDPKPQGILPRDLGINCESWEDDNLDPHITEVLFTKFRIQFLKDLLFSGELVSEQISARLIVQKLIYSSLNTTRTSRRFLRNNPGSPLPTDYELFPGKMDHSTCLAVKVGSVLREDMSKKEISSVLPIHRKWDQPSDRDMSFSLDTMGARAELQCPVLLNITLSASVYEKEEEFLIVCETPPRCNMSCFVDERNVFFRVIPLEELEYEQISGPMFQFGINELDQPIERVVSLPCEVVPGSKEIVTDATAGFVTVRLQKKHSQVQAIDWIPLL